MINFHYEKILISINILKIINCDYELFSYEIEKFLAI